MPLPICNHTHEADHDEFQRCSLSFLQHLVGFVSKCAIILETWLDHHEETFDEDFSPVLSVGGKRYISSDLFSVWHAELKTEILEQEAILKSEVGDHFLLPAPGFRTFFCEHAPIDGEELDAHIPPASLQEVVSQRNHIHASQFSTCGIYVAKVREEIRNMQPDVLSFANVPGTWCDFGALSPNHHHVQAIDIYAAECHGDCGFLDVNDIGLWPESYRPPSLV
jgi:hypothetical protein